MSRVNTLPVADLYPFDVNDRIPSFPLPLRPEDTEPIVDLQVLVNDLYEQLAYDHFIDYQKSPPLPWSETDILSFLQHHRNF